MGTYLQFILTLWPSKSSKFVPSPFFGEILLQGFQTTTLLLLFRLIFLPLVAFFCPLRVRAWRILTIVAETDIYFNGFEIEITLIGVQAGVAESATHSLVWDELALVVVIPVALFQCLSHFFCSEM